MLTFVYGASGKSSRTVSDEYYGQVRPHPDLKLILDAQEAVVSSKADLALILLDEPVEGGFPPMALAQEREEANTPVIIVGHGHDGVSGALDGTRGFSRSKIAKVLEHEDRMFLIPEERPQVHKSDSGGPCLIETEQGPVLVGISSRSLGSAPTCTSIYPYRAWLSAEIQRSESARDGSVP